MTSFLFFLEVRSLVTLQGDFCCLGLCIFLLWSDLLRIEFVVWKKSNLCVAWTGSLVFRLLYLLHTQYSSSKQNTTHRMWRRRTSKMISVGVSIHHIYVHFIRPIWPSRSIELPLKLGKHWIPKTIFLKYTELTKVVLAGKVSFKCKFRL